VHGRDRFDPRAPEERRIVMPGRELRPHRWIIRLVSAFIPKRLRAEWRREWEAEFVYHETETANWGGLGWRARLRLLRWSLGSASDAAWLQRRRLEDDLVQDVRHGLRLIARSPGLALAAYASIAIGIGGATAAFTLIDAALLRPWPYPNADRLVVVRTDLGGFSFPAFRRLVDHTKVLDHLTAGQAHDFVLNFDGQAVLVKGYRVSAEVVPLLGLNGPLHPVAGRAFLPSEFAAASEPVLAISHRLWVTRYGASDSVVGRTIMADGRAFRVVGVLSREFDFFPDSDILVPLTLSGPGTYDEFARSLEVFGSLPAGTRTDQAALRLLATTRGFRPSQTAIVDSVRERMFRGFGPTVRILSLMSLIILMVCCLNFATLLTIRSTDRRQELAVRTALGAGPQRLVRQLVTEALVLSCAGSAAGVLLAYLGRRALAGSATDGILAMPPGLDWRVVTFSTLLAIGTGLLFSVGPAHRAASVDIESGLKGDRYPSMPEMTWLRRFGANWLAGSTQVAFTMVLLIGAALLLKSLGRIQAFDPGYDSANAATIRFELPSARYRTDADVARFVADLTERVRALPGVDDVGAASSLPFAAGTLRMQMILIEGTVNVSGPPEAMPLGWRVPPPPPPALGMGTGDPLTFFLALSCEVDPGFFRTMRIPLLKGRPFTSFDTVSSERVVIINRAMARRYWSDADPIGRRIRIGPLFPWMTIVGVVGDIRRFARDDAVRSEYYEPFAQAGDQRRLAPIPREVAKQFAFAERFASPVMLVVRSRLDAGAIAKAVTPVVRTVDPALPVVQISTLREALDNAIADRRFLLSHVAAFAALALLLPAMGVHAATAHLVRRRGRELSIRAALGARRGHLVWLAMRDGLVIASAGVSVGALISIMLTPQLGVFLYDVSPWDSSTYLWVALVLVPVVMVASYFPARRAARIDPLIALKSV
jgi:putative ABC transport system permease protein